MMKLLWMKHIFVLDDLKSIFAPEDVNAIFALNDLYPIFVQGDLNATEGRKLWVKVKDTDDIIEINLDKVGFIECFFLDKIFSIFSEILNDNQLM